MNGEQANVNPQAGEQRTGYERCVCRDAMDRIAEIFQVPPEVRQHLTNARIEVLKAMRAAINRRIDRLSGTGAQGTKVVVE